MKILVFLKEVPDLSTPSELSEKSGRLRGEGCVPRLNPYDRSSLEKSLEVKETCPEAHVTLVHLGPASGERWIREGLALGCDDGLRIWDTRLQGLYAPAKAMVFARVAEILGFDLIMTGKRSPDTNSCQVGALMACHLDLPHIGSVTHFELQRANGAVTATRSLALGYVERMRCSLPLVVTMDTQQESHRYASFPALLEASERAIPCWGVSDIGISSEQVRRADSLLTYGPLQRPRPRPQFIPAPESSLPAFERIRKLLEGTIRRRAGKVIREEENRVVEELFQTLLKEGWLDHLRQSS